MTYNYHSANVRPALIAGGTLAAMALLGGCVAQPVRTVAAYSPAPTVARPYVYPTRGQSPDQIDRDRYDCYVSAVQQTGFDPSRPERATEEVLVAPAPGTGTATGAVGGAILGSLLAGPRSAGLGFLLGGATGAIVGSAADANAQAQVAQAQARVSETRAAELDRQQQFQRANGACLAARGYSVS
jgi:hypothetical protein